jgi:glycosyltransferase involved in cell wall biosynthesis
LVTVFIPCCNSASTITACLESVRDMADEIIVADAGSTDGTLDLVRRFGGCRILERRGADAAAWEAWAASHARRAWVLRLLPGERLNPELGRQVQDVLAADPAEDGFLISRAVYFRGRRLHHGGFQGESSIRLYRKGAARYAVRDGQVEVRIPSRRVGRLVARLMYESCPSIEQAVSEALAALSLQADEARRHGARPRPWSAAWRPVWQFVSSYVLRGGWLDGTAGLHACCLLSLRAYLREALWWEARDGGDRRVECGRSAVIPIDGQSRSAA